ncbi:hypothetical protein ACQ4PT_032583 [Festuca glaucescens]
MKPVIEASINELFSSTATLLPTKMVITDMGCSSGPNALALVSAVVEAIHSPFLRVQRPRPEAFVFLNDHPDNNFNMVIKSLVTLRQSNEPAVVTGVAPGSFYERLFTSGSLHFACSTNSLHWLSKGLIDKAKFNSFYVPIHGPSNEEMKEIIQEEGSFSISEILPVDSELSTPSRFANQMRAVFEPVIVEHFGEVMDEFVRIAEQHWSLEGIFQDELGRLVMLSISLIKA